MEDWGYIMQLIGDDYDDPPPLGLGLRWCQRENKQKHSTVSFAVYFIHTKSFFYGYEPPLEPSG